VRVTTTHYLCRLSLYPVASSPPRSPTRAFTRSATRWSLRSVSCVHAVCLLAVHQLAGVRLLFLFLLTQSLMSLVLVLLACRPSKYWDVAPPGYENIEPMKYKEMMGMGGGTGAMPGMGGHGVPGMPPPGIPGMPPMMGMGMAPPIPGLGVRCSKLSHVCVCVCVQEFTRHLTHTDAFAHLLLFFVLLPSCAASFVFVVASISSLECDM
jgi:hypothetical protein